MRDRSEKGRWILIFISYTFVYLLIQVLFCIFTCIIYLILCLYLYVYVFLIYYLIMGSINRTMEAIVVLSMVWLRLYGPKVWPTLGSAARKSLLPEYTGDAPAKKRQASTPQAIPFSH